MMMGQGPLLKLIIATPCLFSQVVSATTGESPSTSPTAESPSTSPTADECDKIEEADMIDVFTDFRKILLSVFLAIVLTLPAVSIYWRHTEQRPKKSYYYSCIVKFVACFFSVSALVGGIYQFMFDNGCYGKEVVVSLSLASAIVTEAIEFIFDFGRLVLCFGDPGTLDFYQNARWNSKVSSTAIGCLAVGLSSIPISILMFIMWLMVLLAQLFEDNLPWDVNVLIEEAAGDFNYNRHIWFRVSLIFGTLSCSFVGAYHLIRMVCPCQANSGEDNGIGYHWGQFKLIAVDVPSLIMTGILEPSGLVMFWTAEFLNDGFPLVVGYVIEKYLLVEEEEEEEENKGDDLEDNVVADDDKKGGNKDLHQESYQVVLFPFKGNFTIDRNFPSFLEGRIDETSWADFCDQIDFTFEAASLTRRLKIDVCCKLACITLGLATAMFYWVFIYKNLFSPLETETDDNVYTDDYTPTQPQTQFTTQPVEPSVYYTVLIICWSIGGLFCTKLCFGRDVGSSETELIDSLEEACSDFSKKSNVPCSLKIETSIPKWLCRGGLSCAPGIDSIDGIEFILNHDDPEPSAPEVADVVVVKMASSKSL